MGSSRTGRTFDLASTIASRGRLFFLSDVPNRSEENHGGGIGKMRKRPGDCFVLSASLQHQKNTDDGVVVRAPLIRCPSSRRRQRLADNSSIRTDSIQSDTRVIDHGYEPWRCGEGRVPSGSNRVRKRAARPLVGAESMRKDMIIAGRRKRWKEVGDTRCRICERRPHSGDQTRQRMLELYPCSCPRRVRPQAGHW